MASRSRPYNHSCIVAQWLANTRALSLPGARLTQRMLAQTLLGVLEDRRLHLNSCVASRAICEPRKSRMQIWELEPLRQRPAQSCPTHTLDRESDLPSSSIHLDASEIAAAAMRPATLQRTRRALRRAGVARIGSALDAASVSALRAELLSDTARYRNAPVLASEHREHLMLDPDAPAVARALTALGIRADAHGTRRGVLAEVVPEGAALTELASIVARAGASAQSMHHDTQGHYGDAAMTTAFVVLQDTPAELGALRVVRGSHATQSREGSACGDGSEHAATVLSATAGSAVLMDSRTFHGGGANTLSCLPPAAADGSGTTTTTTVTETAPTTATTATAAAPFSSSSTTTTRVVFYFSWVDGRSASAPYLPIGSTYALKGELWGRMRVPLMPMGPLHAPPARGGVGAGGFGTDGVGADGVRAGASTQPEHNGTLGAPGSMSSDGARLHGARLDGAWTILDLVTARLELCTESVGPREWSATTALRCLLGFGAGNAAMLFVRHREHESATLGIVDDERSMA